MDLANNTKGKDDLQPVKLQLSKLMLRKRQQMLL
jgi:hypothetical protein